MKKALKFSMILMLIGLGCILISWPASGFNWHKLNPQILNQTDWQKKQVQTVKPFHHLTLNTDLDVKVKAGDHFKVESQAAKGIHLNTRVTNDQLVVTQTGSASSKLWWEKWGIHLGNNINVNNNFGSNEHGEVTIYVPKKTHLTSLNQGSQNININLDHLTVRNALQLHGGVMLNQVTAKAVTVANRGSDIMINNSHFNADPSKITSSYGDIVVRNSRFNKINTINSEDGDITVDHTHILAGSTIVKSSEGDLAVHNNQVAGLSMISENGDINFSNLHVMDNLKGTSDNGDITGKVPRTLRAHIITHSDSGDVVVKVANHFKANQNYHFTSDNGDITIKYD